ncbi:MAG: aminomethyl-transferring glycine dehydrogenase subunit GcvPA, partial [Dokdonella sp.]|nr:aminomethyl-transferring glycine dehydrogenase subunit GcvPA [Dokdonella sp.]
MRYLPHTEADRRAMLAAIGAPSIEALFRDVPERARLSRPVDLPPHKTELEVERAIGALAAQNKHAGSMACFLGGGAYRHHVPAAVDHLIQRGEFLTSYTPYQPEVSQGTLQYLFEFQTQVGMITGMEVANASLYDGATATAEAVMMANRVTRRGKAVLSGGLHPHYRDVVATYARWGGFEAVSAAPDPRGTTDLASMIDADTSCVVVQNPSVFGRLRDLAPLAKAAQAKGALLVVVVTEVVSLGLVQPPGAMGADIVAAEGQSIGNALNFGGPYVGLFATREKYLRQMPGRLVGETVDTDGRRGWVLTLSTREQHIRREKATSNICTAQVLLAVMAAMYAVYHGPDGLTRIARRVARHTAILKAGLMRLGYDRFHHDRGCFDTLSLNTGERTDTLLARARALGANLRKAWDEYICISLDETTTRADIELLWRIFGGDGAALPSIDELDATAPSLIPAELERKSAFLTHPVFNTHHSEHEMLRYLRSLADKDLAMDRTMIPLGSCTMKLNATAEMIPVTWPEFANIHPFVPAEQARGYQELIEGLEAMLVECTGYDAVSLQPNSGAQGEYAGLLAIRAWHRSRGEGHRDICLIPESAHGTNPASAQMCGMTVVVTKCDANGNVDVEDIRRNAEKHADR